MKLLIESNKNVAFNPINHIISYQPIQSQKPSGEPMSTPAHQSIVRQQENWSSQGAHSSRTYQPSIKKSKTEPLTQHQLIQREDGYWLSGDRIVVYTDGASSHNQHKNKGGSGCGIYWGGEFCLSLIIKFILVHFSLIKMYLEIHQESHPNPSTLPSQNTNNFAEAHAIEYALKYAVEQKMEKIEIRTDSMYCIDSLDKYMKSWMSKAKMTGGIWKNAKGETIVHQQVFMSINDMRKIVDTRLVHVRGHTGERGNEAADRLAATGARRYIELQNSH